MADDTHPDLETFRQQWKAEVTARSKPPSKPSSDQLARSPGLPPNGDSNTIGGVDQVDQSGDDHREDINERWGPRRHREGTYPSSPKNPSISEPRSALEHYEQAVERESQGNLGDSLKLYRKAYKVYIR